MLYNVNSNSIPLTVLMYDHTEFLDSLHKDDNFSYQNIWVFQFYLTVLYSSVKVDILVYLLIVRLLDYSKSRMHKPAKSTILSHFFSLPVHKNTFPKTGKPNVTLTVHLLSEN